MGLSGESVRPWVRRPCGEQTSRVDAWATSLERSSAPHLHAPHMDRDRIRLSIGMSREEPRVSFKICLAMSILHDGPQEDTLLAPMPVTRPSGLILLPACQRQGGGRPTAGIVHEASPGCVRSAVTPPPGGSRLPDLSMMLDDPGAGPCARRHAARTRIASSAWPPTARCQPGRASLTRTPRRCRRPLCSWKRLTTCSLEARRR